MNSIIEILQTKRGFLSGDGVSEKEIEKAEKKIGVKFADSYKEYLRTFGIAAYSGHELTGISKSKRTDVAEVTLKEREYNRNVPEDLYVIEETNMEGIVIWQSSEGEIYRTDLDSKPKKVAKSMEEYISH